MLHNAGVVNNNNNNNKFVIKMSIVTCYKVYRVIRMHNIKTTNGTIHSLVYNKPTYICYLFGGRLASSVAGLGVNSN